MRAIKFRAWDAEQNKMFLTRDQASLSWDSENGTNFICELEYIGEDGKRDWTCSEDAIVMQFTGLLDKNGKEIYEGDVVDVEQCESFVITRFEDSASFVGSGTFTGKIRWVENREHFRNEFQINLSTCEVIGNIHQNPDLLK